MTAKFQNHSITLEILRAKMNVKKVDISENHFHASAAADTPTRGINDERLQEEGEDEGNHSMGEEGEGESDYVDEDDLRQLPNPPTHINWTLSGIEGIVYNLEHGKMWLLNKKELFYMERDAAVTEMETEQSLQLFE